MAVNWTNYGDINFTAYGGCLVKPHWDEETLKEYPDLSSMYDIFYLNPEMDEEGMAFAALYCVDLDDAWINKKDVLYAIGLEDHSPDELPPMQMAKEVVEYYGSNCSAISYKSQYPYTREDFLITHADVADWMRALGAEEFI